MSEQTSECSGAREQREQCRASKRVRDLSGQANGRASGPVLTSVFLVFLDHSAFAVKESRGRKVGMNEGEKQEKDEGLEFYNIDNLLDSVSIFCRAFTFFTSGRARQWDLTRVRES